MIGGRNGLRTALSWKWQCNLVEGVGRRESTRYIARLPTSSIGGRDIVEAEEPNYCFCEAVSFMRLRALPARNHPSWCSLNVCDNSISSEVPSA